MSNSAPPPEPLGTPDDQPRIGELFSGYGGLGMGVQSVYGGTIAWHSDIDKGACKILAHRYPDVPNIGDITAVDWSQVEPVDILTGGSPCQDLSHAGRRAGMTEGTRSNLWVAMREAIAQLRPGMVIWENVRGAYSAAATSELEPCPGCVGDGPGVHLRALGRVLGDLSDLGYDCRWHGLRAADIGAPHGRFRVFVVATRDATSHHGRHDTFATHGRGRRDEGQARAAGGAPADIAGRGLLPTPRATDGTKGGPGQRGSSGDLMLPSAVALLPTPTSSDAKASGSAGYGGNDFCTLTDVAVRGKGGFLLPTPTTEPDTGNGHARNLGKEARLLQTPSTADGGGGHERRGGARGDELLLNGQAQQMHGGRWGDYADAIARWEAALGRSAPAPTMLSAKGNPQLAPRFVEWLMGLPAGWVDDVPGLTRNEKLKALGNGVVPQQAAEALRVMAAWEVAA